ncbi:hypothetical protein ABEB36_003471 [Hypothenemus hampei]|uniref:Pyridoxal phosphate phosphatase PHOSPHO2 n=1 Tax=Hypothenemus hampei TaxID=57062 RepID=A0ABD1F984_HYPHA
MKNLAVFDFDYTIIDDNSDTAVMKLVDENKFSPELKELYKSDGWTKFMQEVFKVLHDNSVSESDIASLIANISEVRGLKDLIRKLHDTMGYDVIIISDSNTYFINLWLKANNLSSKVLKVFSNPAYFNEQGLLMINMFHVQDSCKLSTENMCKGMIMEDFIKDQSKNSIIYDKILYVGDGQNDLCPILRLNNNKALACCRKNYKCANLIKKIKEGQLRDNDLYGKYEIKANIFIWETGYDILEFLIQ